MLEKHFSCCALIGQTSPQILPITLVAVLLLGMLYMLMRAAKLTVDRQETIPNLRPEFFFWLNILYFLLIAGFALAYVGDFVPLKKAISSPIGGILPIPVPLFGALGAVMISMQAVFLLNDQWKPKWNYWHIARPLTGAIMGSVSFFLLQIINSLSDGTSVQEMKGGVAYWVLAFLVGYREETFRELMKRATDLILRPGGQEETPVPSVIFKKEGTKIVEVKCGAEGATVEVQNIGRAPLRSPEIAFDGDFEINEEDDKVSGHDIAPGDHRTVKVIPSGEDFLPGTLTVTGPNLDTPATIPLLHQQEAN